MLISASSSHLQLCGSKPCPRVIVQDKDAIFAIGWPVLRAGLDYVVHGLFWVAAVACGRVFQTPAFHSGSETANTGSEAVECCPLSAWEVFAQQLAWLIHESVQPRVGLLPAILPSTCVWATFSWRRQPVWIAGADGHAPWRAVVTSGGRVVGSLWQPGGGDDPRCWWWPYEIVALGTCFQQLFCKYFHFEFCSPFHPEKNHVNFQIRPNLPWITQAEHVFE